jgi:hypothetical protein
MYSIRWLGLVPAFPNGKPVGVFSQPSNNSFGCSIAAPGVAYTNLAEKTGGKVYDICQPDWTEHFNNLASSSARLSYVLSGLSPEKNYSVASLQGFSADGAEIALNTTQATVNSANSSVTLEFSELSSNIKKFSYSLKETPKK